MIDVSLPVPADRPFPWRTVVACLTTIACLLGWQLETNRLRSNAVPIGLQAMMTYESLAGDGFMPGSNKTLLRVFVIPRIIASVIAEGKQPFLAAQYPEYREWRETPVVMDGHWPPIHCECLTPIAGPIGNYLERSLRISLDPAVEKTINDALLAPGSFYAYRGNYSLLLIIPSKAMAVYAFVK